MTLGSGMQAADGDEEDLDFIAEKDDDGSPSDDSRGDDSDDSDSGDEKEKTLKKKEPSSSKPSSSKKRNKGDNDGKKSEDLNAPKRAMSGFMFFSQLERENVKKDNLEFHSRILLGFLENDGTN